MKVQPYQNYKKKNFPVQKYDYVCVLDFEANQIEFTNSKKKSLPGRAKMEIIEFPIVLVNTKTLKIESAFESYVQPTKVKKINKECTKITSITQNDVDKAEELSVVMKKVDAFLKEKLINRKKSFIFCTCGDWDLKTQLKEQCERDGIERPTYFKSYINIKKAFKSHYKPKRYEMKFVSMKTMLNYLRLKLTGKHHRGIDDCKNIAKIVIKLIKDGCILEETFTEIEK